MCSKAFWLLVGNQPDPQAKNATVIYANRIREKLSFVLELDVASASRFGEKARC